LKSAALIANDLSVAAKGSIEFVNTHLGSYGDQPRAKGFAHMCAALSTLVRKAPAGPMLLLENSAAGGNRCAGSLEEIGEVVRAVGSRRVGVCLDTAHLWASGYAIDTKRGVTQMLHDADKHIGFERIRVLHINDTRVALGARNDVHWHVGQGRVGEAGFRALFTCRGLAHVACICETPKTAELDLLNVRAAKRFAGRRGAANGNTPKSQPLQL
ncbi:MAG: TIM barrel protein, partial [Candidatus Eremiobacteraeota bacterium]|nr:TIM barrel protein [Candidatus Eremiobacteraeota bacterium]